MAKTFDEMLELIADNIDEVTLLEVLELTSDDIVEAFSERIKDNIEKFNGLEEDVEDEY